MTEANRQLIFDLAVAGAFITLGAFAWRDITKLPKIQGRRRKLLIVSAAIFSCNILLLCMLFGVDYLAESNHAHSQASPAQHKSMLVILWTSLVGMVISIGTVALALFSERCIARKLCIWGSSAALVWWGLVYMVISDGIAVYLVSPH
jgi:hypothetical protein